MDTKNKVFVVIGSVALLASATIGGYSLFATADDTSASTVGTLSQVATTSTNTTSSTTTAATTSTNTSSSSGSYKDGTYSTTVSYSVPHGATNSLKATVTIASGKITAVSTDDTYSDHKSAMYVQDFESALESAVAGSDASSASFSRIGGASLTTDAFSNALDTILTQATA